MAKVIHANGDRADRPFISVNCGAIPDNLLESELFGHRKGAFTGASGDRKGKFESAHARHHLPRRDRRAAVVRPGEAAARAGGARDPARGLRRAHRRGRARRGGHQPQPAQAVRGRQVPRGPVLPAQRHSRHAAAAARAQGRDPAAVRVLRRRGGRSAEAAPDRDDAGRCAQFLLDYAYPGNIRELRNIIYRLSCLAGQTADLEHLPADIRPAPPVQRRAARAPARRWPRGERRRRSARPSAPPATRPSARFWSGALQEVGGMVTELARRCDMNRSHVQTLLKKHGIRSKDCRNGNAARATSRLTIDRPRPVAAHSTGWISGPVGAVQVFGADHHGRDVVAPAALERQIEQRLRTPAGNCPAAVPARCPLR